MELLERRRERYTARAVIAEGLEEIEEIDPMMDPGNPLFDEEAYEMAVINWYRDAA
jgi:hypothetical protein